MKILIKTLSKSGGYILAQLSRNDGCEEEHYVRSIVSNKS